MSHTSSMWNKIPKWADTVLHQPFLQPRCSDWMTETRIVALVSTHTERKLKRAFLKHSLVFSTHPGWFASSGNLSLLQGTLSQQKQAETENLQRESWRRVAGRCWNMKVRSGVVSGSDDITAHSDQKCCSQCSDGRYNNIIHTTVDPSAGSGSFFSTANR